MGVASIVTDAKVGEILSSFSFPVAERERERGGGKSNAATELAQKVF